MIYTVPVYFLMMVSFETGSDASEYIGRNDGAKGCTRRQIFPHRRGILSDVETEVHDVAIMCVRHAICLCYCRSCGDYGECEN